MLNVLRKEAINNLLKQGTLTFNKDIETTLKESEYSYLLYKIDVANLTLSEFANIQTKLRSLLDKDFKLFLNDVIFKLKFYEYPEELKILLSKLSVTGTTFIVGGAIRDIILNKKPKDFDIVTDIPYEKLKVIFRGFKQKEVGAHFKVLIVNVGNVQFEIANFRKDVYISKDGKGADDVEIGTLDDDIQRRDFDVNCLYFNPTKQPFNLIDGNQTGLISLMNNEFRFVGKPEDRIKEDVLRLLRVGKLKQKGLIPTTETIKAFRRNFHLLCELGNPTRIREHVEELCFN